MQPLGTAPARIDYLQAVCDYASRWHEAGLPVPKDYLNSDAQPSSLEQRRYQLRRGPGDGRSVDSVVYQLWTSTSTP